MSEPDYCGCCGNEIALSARSSPFWCTRCAKHVSRSYRGSHHVPLWERTYTALTGKPCPYQVS